MRQDTKPIDNGGPAFPSAMEVRFGDYATAGHAEMSLRDWFATHAPEPPQEWRGGDRKLPDVIEWRWWYADAMLKARKE
jgi:hypothetical protein